MTKSLNKDSIESIFHIFAQLNPHPKTELEYTNNFTLLIAVVLSAQATDKRVNLITKDLFATYDTPEKIIELGESGLIEYIKTINYFKTKARHIIQLSNQLVEKYHSIVPSTLEELIKLPGVGRKTANVVLNCAFGAAVVPVDTHILRVSQRLGLAKGKTPEHVEDELMKIIPQHLLDKAHHWLVLHGRYICKARKPMCNICPVKQLCRYYHDVLDLKVSE